MEGNEYTALGCELAALIFMHGPLMMQVSKQTGSSAHFVILLLGHAEVHVLLKSSLLIIHVLELHNNIC